ncbi:MAG: hypothetical protein GX358_06015 [candidate division WS1 bacterium]|jgi:hypothetical protein|nr:hypothetical protein [candidate division WS1 bacterium]
MRLLCRPRTTYRLYRLRSGYAHVLAAFQRPPDCHGPVTRFVPGSALQTCRTDYTMIGALTDNVEIGMS